MPFSKMVIKLNHDGVAELLKGNEVQRLLDASANRIADQATANSNIPEADFGVDVLVGRSRARASVFTANVEAMLAESNDQALTRAIDAGR